MNALTFTPFKDLDAHQGGDEPYVDGKQDDDDGDHVEVPLSIREFLNYFFHALYL